MSQVTVTRALLSVSDKTGLVEFARGLVKYGVSLISTGGTFIALRDAGLPVTEIEAFTGFPEMLDGRVKTLHPAVHAGLLYRRDLPVHVETMKQHGLKPIDLVVVNLYPFEATIARPTTTREEAIEQIDIGGPSMIRSAAKNQAHVAVLTNPAHYGELLAELEATGGKTRLESRRRWARIAFERTARYDRAIADYLSRDEMNGTPAESADENLFPSTLTGEWRRTAVLRYGENPHQSAAFYVEDDYPAASVASAETFHGKELSYNNLLDLDSALSIARDFERPCAVVIKHNNPCGAAVADTLAEAFVNAYEGDPVSAFGSVLGFNREIDEATARHITEPKRFVEAIIAPSFTPEAIHLLTTRPTWKASVRLLRTGDLARGAAERARRPLLRPVEGGMLRQLPDLGPNGFDDRRVVTTCQPSDVQLRDLAFAWGIVKHVRSNAIVLVKNESLVGVGAGQMSRVDSTKLAIEKAGARAAGSVLGSDAFFPFRDNVDQAAAAGIAAIVQPGGSKRDEETIAACNEHGIPMLFTGRRHFKH